MLDSVAASIDGPIGYTIVSASSAFGVHYDVCYYNDDKDDEEEEEEGVETKEELGPSEPKKQKD